MDFIASKIYHATPTDIEEQRENKRGRNGGKIEKMKKGEEWVQDRERSESERKRKKEIKMNILFLQLSYSAVWANFALCSNCGQGSQAQYYPHSYKWSKEGPGPVPRARANEGPRTTIRAMDKIAIRGELKHAGEELGHVRGRWSPRDFCPRYLVNSLITQNNAWEKSYNRAKGEISNKK